MIIALAVGAANHDQRDEDGTKIVLTQNLVSDIEQETEEVKNEPMEKEPPKENIVETETEKINAYDEGLKNLDCHYGCYRFTEFYPLEPRIKASAATDQEADLLLGRVISIEPERLVTYDIGRREFDNFNMVYRYVIENPAYNWQWWGGASSISNSFFYLQEAAGDEYASHLDKWILECPVVPGRYSAYEHHYYTMDDKDKLILHSKFMDGYFVLERCDEEPAEPLPEWTQQERLELLQKVYGEYQVTDFLPTKYYPVIDSSGYELLPKEEANMMKGKTIIISQNLFETYDNYRRINSKSAGREKDDSWLAEVDIEEPDYQVKSVRANEIYGIRDGMLSDDLNQQEYVEIDVYPGHEMNDCLFLPQMYLIEDGRIILQAMGEYFLLESKVTPTSYNYNGGRDR